MKWLHWGRVTPESTVAAELKNARSMQSKHHVLGIQDASASALCHITARHHDELAQHYAWVIKSLENPLPRNPQ